MKLRIGVAVLVLVGMCLGAAKDYVLTYKRVHTSAIVVSCANGATPRLEPITDESPVVIVACPGKENGK